MSKEYLVHGYYDGGYYGTGVESYEILSQKEWDLLQEAIDNNYEVWVNEWSGKYSEDSFTIPEVIKFVTSDPEKIKTFRELFNANSIGAINLAEYIIDNWVESDEYYYLHHDNEEDE